MCVCVYGAVKPSLVQDHQHIWGSAYHAYQAYGRSISFRFQMHIHNFSIRKKEKNKWRLFQHPIHF